MLQAPVMSVPTARRAAGDMLIACARTCLDPAAIDTVRNSLSNPDLDWPTTIEIAHEHGVLPLLHSALHSADAPSVPPDIRQQLQQQAHEYAARNMLLMQQLIRLLRAMQDQKIRVLPYKGPTLAMFGYGNLSLRPPGDLDIVVPAADMARARQVLESLGFRMVHQMDAKAEAEYLASPHEYDLVYTRESDKVCVELHWRMSGHFFSFNPDPVDLWTRATEKKLAGLPVRVFCPEDMLLVLCAHGMKHFWTRLSWICDLAMCIRNTPSIDWDLMLARASELEARKMTLLGLLLASDTIGAAVPEMVLAEARKLVQPQAAELRERLFLETTTENNRPGVDWQLTDGGLFRSLVFHVKTRETWSSGLRYFFHRGFTPNIVDHEWVHLPRHLSFLYYVVRPLRLMLKYGPLRFISRRQA